MAEHETTTLADEAGAAIDETYRSARSARDKLNGVLSDLSSRGKQAEASLREGVDRTEQKIRENPLAAVGIAAGVGLLLGLLINRSR